MHPPEFWPLYLASAVFGYLLGSLPTGYLVGRRHGIDIREHGSGNIGATNVVRVLGKKPGYLVFACDALKGLLSVRLTILFVRLMGRHDYESLRLDDEFINGVLRRSGLTDPAAQETPRLLEQITVHYAHAAVWAGIIGALCCILGHNFPVWLRFRGGKGVATTVGVLLGLMPLAFLVAAVVWVASFYAFRYVSLASLLAAGVLPPAVWLITRHTDAAGGGFGPMFGFSVVAAALVFLRHRANITRLLNGTESRFTPKPKTAGPP